MTFNKTEFESYTAVRGVMNLLLYQNDAPMKGTGVQILYDQSVNLLGSPPPILTDFNSHYQINLFGNYPTKTDVVPSAIFAATFGIIMLLHVAVFSINASRGHFFWLSLLFAFYSAMKVIGFTLRIYWYPQLWATTLGITGEVFLILSSIFLTSLNLILAQRIFTWRHPVGGSRRLFWNLMISFYAFVVVIVAITVLASAVPYVNFLSEQSFKNWQKVVQASSILIVFYSVTSTCLIALAYFFKPTRKDENLYTYQPWWIESFSPFYFVRPGAAREAEETFMKRNHNHRYAVRVIAATHHHYNMVEGLTNERGDLKHNVSIGILVVSTVMILIGSILRCIVVFQGRPTYLSGPVAKPVAMYICWGLFEVIINGMYLIGRVDLRFYRPDRLPKKVRNIITAEQSGFVSDNDDEETEEYEDYEDDFEKEFGADKDLESGDSYDGQDDIQFNPKPPIYDFEVKNNRKNSDEFHF